MNGKKNIYMNQMQRDALLLRMNKTVVCAGRGTGKGLLHAAVMVDTFLRMPRSTTAFVVPNTKRGLTNTLPSMFYHWEAWGYKRDIHWCVGRRPPKKLGWAQPIFVPDNWDNIISFFNGAIGQIISQERRGTSNSKSFDFIDIDEAKYIDFAQLKDETFPANRGQVREFGACPFHHGMLITSDMPVTSRGSWFLNYERDCDPSVLETVRGIMAEIAHLRAKGRKNPVAMAAASRLAADLDEIRRVGTFFGKYPSMINMEVLGEEWFRQMRRDLPPAQFLTSILCERPDGALRDGFYSSMTPDLYYDASDEHYIDSLGYDTERLGQVDGRMDADVREDVPLCIAFDYNGNINLLVVGQPDEDERRLNVVKEFYVKYERKLPGLIDDFAAYYSHRRDKTVVFYFDATALGSNYAVNSEDFRWVIVHQLELNGWTVVPIYIGNPMNHLEKHLLINRAFEGRTRLQPHFNRANCENLLVSMETAGMVGGKKDKSGEKRPETEENLLEHRTDFSDAFDTLYIGCENFPQTVAVYAVTSDF